MMQEESARGDEHTSRKRVTPRQRARESTLHEARQIALRQLAEGGIEALSLKSIAIELGLTGPAIYRYFANRNELLTSLIVASYDDLAAALNAVALGAENQRPAEQLGALARAYRGWALAQPHRYRLLFAAPVPGYDANSQQLVEAADRSMAILLSVMEEATHAGSVRPPLVRPLATQLRKWAKALGRDSRNPDVLYRGVVTWSRLHGFVSLEIDGAFDSMGIDADLLFRREVDALAEI
jgi:AcrR family transcriptional regulator